MRNEGKDVLCLYIFDIDSIKKYGIDTLVANKNYSAQIIPLQDLIEHNWRVKIR